MLYKYLWVNQGYIIRNWNKSWQTKNKADQLESWDYE